MVAKHENEPTPVVTRPEEFNRLLIALSDHGGEEGLSHEAILSMATSATFHAEIPAHEETLSAAVHLGFVSLSTDRYVLAELGRMFVGLNPESTYELASGQAEFFLKNCVLTGGYADLARTLLGLFRKRGTKREFGMDMTDPRITDAMRRLIALLRRLGMFSIVGTSAVVLNEHAALASALRVQRRMTLAELEAILQMRREQGQAAELWVLEYERMRLRNAGCEVEARAVSIVSDTDVAAGYDIESFNGTSEDLSPDRFIEVKSTAGGALVFIWSQNEYAKSREFGDRYWIYHLRSFVPGAVTAPNLVMIRNPYELCRLGEITLSAASYQAEVQSSGRLS
jgi:hypothetical protein